ncbi:hypothetical protein ACS0TY_007960 [Phlomoides rotata]
MSGGFFRGTSADQDTRFSNKQAKLLKSQKFAPELENLVDMTKVKMDVMKPWIAKRVTELIGFEDEVLINFIYGLLEGKAVNGKQVQISLTGFMERNTGKFMKELWALLISAQQNVSGVPQQFLDAKEEETKKKKEETDRITNEIQRKKEKENQELEEEKAKMDGDGAQRRDKNSELKPNVKHDAGGSTVQPAADKERYRRNGRRRSSRGSQSPGSPYRSPSPRERRRSRSFSGSPPSRSRSISPERQDRSAPRRSMTPRRRHIIRRSPSPWRRSSHLRRRSRSPSPARYRVHSPRSHRSRSPLRRRSRSPVRRWSRSPVRRRPPMRRRSRTPVRRTPVQYRPRTPLRRRSPSPMQGRSLSPIRGRSPSLVRHRSPSPIRQRSPSLVHHSSSPPVRRGLRSELRRRSPSPHQRSPSPARRRRQRSLSRSISPDQRRSSMHVRKRSISPSGISPLHESSSPSHVHHSSLSPVRRGSLRSVRSPIQSPAERTRHGKYSSARRASPNERAEPPAEDREGKNSVERRPVVSLRSPQRDMLDRSEGHGKPRKQSPSMENSPVGSDASRGRSDSEERRPMSPRGSPHHARRKIVQPESPSPLRKAVEPKAHRRSSVTSVHDESNFSNREIGEPRYRSSGKISPMPVRHKNLTDSVEIHGLADRTNSRKTQLPNSVRLRDTADHKEHRGRPDLSTTSKTTSMSVKSKESYDDGARAKDKKIDRVDDRKGGYQIPELEDLPESPRKSDQNGLMNSPSKEPNEHRRKVNEKRKHKKSEIRDVESDDYSSYDSYEERKDAKRRKKEEKKLKKEERRRRREEKHRRRDERRAEKLKLKSSDADLAQDLSEDEIVKRRESRASNNKESASEQKRLEIELREKALESLRAKKGFGN